MVLHWLKKYRQKGDKKKDSTVTDELGEVEKKQDVCDTNKTGEKQETERIKYPRLKEQLSKKSRHFGVIPGSFYERFESFAPKSSLPHVVEPRYEGTVQYRHGAFSQWIQAQCHLKGGNLELYKIMKENGGEISSVPTLTAQLVGAHLRGGERNASIFSLDGAESGKGTLNIRTNSAAERDEWMVALGRVPGLLRRATDYYTLGKTWGAGATSEVREVVGKFTGKRLALKKRLKVSKESTQAMHNELRILQICAKHDPHPAIPQLEDFFFDTDGRIELVLELMEGGELFDWIASRDSLNEAQARAVFEQIASGVAYLHSLGIAHRDLKPENLMCTVAKAPNDIPSIKIMDYDLAKVNYCPTWEGSTPCGTTHYMAPEIVRHRRYSLSIDCWSLGVILYILLTGNLPFVGKNDSSVHRAINGGKFSMDDPVWDTVSDEAKDLVRRLLTLNPKERISAAECLGHPWLAPSIAPESTSGYKNVSGDKIAAGTSKNNFLTPDATQRKAARLVLDKAASLRELRTVQNLRLISSGECSSMPSFPYNPENFAGLGKKGDSPNESHNRKTGASLSKALHYSLETIRAQENSMDDVNYQDHQESHVASPKNDLRQDDRKLSQLRVSLDLVGTAAGILDSKAAQAQPGEYGKSYEKSMTPNSPETSFKMYELNDEFEDMDLTPVDGEDDIDDETQDMHRKP